MYPSLTIKFSRHQIYSKYLVYAADPRGVYLTVLHGAALQELLEHDAVGAHLARRHADTVGPKCDDSFIITCIIKVYVCNNMYFIFLYTSGT